MGSRLVLIIIAVLAAADSAGASTVSERLQECAKIQDPAARLACYEAAAAQAAAAAVVSKQHTAGTGKWVLDDSVDPMNDKRILALLLPADSGTQLLGGPIGLGIRCIDRRMDVIIIWGHLLPSSPSVSWRIGVAAAQAREWFASEDHDSTFYPTDATGFVRQLMHADRLVARVTTMSGTKVTAEFDLRGLTEAVVPLREACGWN